MIWDSLVAGSVRTSKLAREFLKGFSKWGNKDPEPVSYCQTYIHVRACFFLLFVTFFYFYRNAHQALDYTTGACSCVIK